VTDLDAVSIWAVINLILWQMAIWVYFGGDESGEEDNHHNESD
jgi:hypothetical protein